MGGPPLVSPIRVKVGGLARKDAEERDILFIVMTPNSIISTQLTVSQDNTVLTSSVKNSNRYKHVI